ncbi:unannotated protein [freshwater metagenome]|uniref:Unannotated protein n=1 Tax=freshwater metagenome TaxID=449393 RepID=A0A6J7CJR4_9ZZZZ
MSEAKRQLRTDMRRLRAAIADRLHRSAALGGLVVDSFGPSGVAGLHVLAFVGVGGEPDTTGLLDSLWQGGALVYLPRVIGDHMVAVRHDRGDPLEVGAYGIPAPIGEACDPTVIDAVVVPGLAFTLDGCRLGQGGGYYDRFLPLVRSDCVTVGVCFREQIVDSIPNEDHDRNMSRVICDGVSQ